MKPAQYDIEQIRRHPAAAAQDVVDVRLRYAQFSGQSTLRKLAILYFAAHQRDDSALQPVKIVSHLYFSVK